ncbi:MAG: YhbY family RNA-binding protein [Oscillospiraceae bacterium]
MTSKERANFRSQANGIEVLFQVGKGGISDALIKQTDDALKARELIKLKVLETSPESAKEIANKLAEATESEVVSVIGGSMIFYRYNKKLHEKKKVKLTVKKVVKTNRRDRTGRTTNATGVDRLRSKR